jgi:hypothetical protein
MPKAKTKKRRRQATKKKKLPNRKKVAKKIKKKSAGKKIIKKRLPKAVSLEIEKPQAKEILPAEIALPPVIHASPLIEKAKNEVITRKNTKLSPYLLDLKNSLTAKNNAKEKADNVAQKISAEIFHKFSKKTKKINKKFQNFYHNIQTNLQELKPKETKIRHRAKNPWRIKFPEINFPNIEWQFPKLQPVEIRLGRFVFPASWKKTLLCFLIFCFIFVAPFQIYGYYQNLQGKKNDVLQKTSEAIIHLTLSQKAASAQDLYYTQLELKAASENFGQAKEKFDEINFLIEEIIKVTPKINEQFVSAQKLIDLGEKLTRSAALLTATLDKINLENSHQELALTDKLTILKDNLNLILPDIVSANQDFEQIYLDQIPPEYQTKIQALQNALPLLEKNISTFIDYSDLIAKFLGQESKKRYLALFQNNHEIRPTGGFIGSFALVDIDRGNIEKLDIPGGGPYDLKAGLKVNIKSPTPLNILNQRWEFQDANWFADLPASAEKLTWFYEKSGGPSVDGIIFINATFLQNLLDIVGPIELPQYNLTVTSQNFFQVIQENVELNYDKEVNKPKQIIADLTPKILAALFNYNQKKFTDTFELILNSLEKKEIQLYFSNYALERLVLNNNWGGQIKNTDRDFLEIVSTNIAGEKTDAKIEQLVDLKVDIKSDGSIINNLQIKKTHTGKEGENFYGVPNIDYLRIYVPKGSELLSATGFSEIPAELLTTIDPEIYQLDPDLSNAEFNKNIEPLSKTEIYTESNKTVFANWIKTEPGQSQLIILSYKLPFNLNLENKENSLAILNYLKEKLNLPNDIDTEKYTLLWQKQSGKKDYPISLEINLPQNLNYQIIYPDNLNKKENIFTTQSVLDTDKFYAIIYSLK